MDWFDWLTILKRNYRFSDQQFTRQRSMIICLPRCSWTASASTARHRRKLRCTPTNSMPSSCTWVLLWHRDTTSPTRESVHQRLITPPALVRKPLPRPLPPCTTAVDRVPIAIATIPAVLEDYCAFSSPNRAVRWEPSRWTIPATALLTCCAGKLSYCQSIRTINNQLLMLIGQSTVAVQDRANCWEILSIKRRKETARAEKARPVVAVRAVPTICPMMCGSSAMMKWFVSCGCANSKTYSAANRGLQH